MYAKFKPVSEEAYPLGEIMGHGFSINVSRKSCFDGFEQHTNLPCLHLIVTADAASVTWNYWFGKMHPTGMIEDEAELRIGSVIAHFFGQALTLEHAAWRIERNSPKAARRKTVHMHLKIGHEDLFGEDGLVKQCVQSDLRPNVIDEEKVRKVVMAIQTVQPSYFRNVTMNFGTNEAIFSSFISRVTKVANS